MHLRPCELQISDFENAAVSCFVMLLTRSILSCQWNFLMPISLVDENMKRAQVQRCTVTMCSNLSYFSAARLSADGEVLVAEKYLHGVRGY